MELKIRMKIVKLKLELKLQVNNLKLHANPGFEVSTFTS